MGDVVLDARLDGDGKVQSLGRSNLMDFFRPREVDRDGTRVNRGPRPDLG